MKGDESEPDCAREEAKGKNIFWYSENIDKEVTPEFRKFMTAYSEIPDEDKAWVIRAYPCTGQGPFLNPLIMRTPAYPEILANLKAGGRMVEIGSFIGHDLRRLVFNGAPSENLYAVDIVSHWDVGFHMFKDRQSFHANFIESDIIHPSPQLLALNSTADVIYISKVLHQWDRETQLAALQSMIALSKPGSIVVGFHAAVIDGGFVAYEKGSLKMWLHDAQSWRDMWDEASKGTNTRWDASYVVMRDFGRLGNAPDALVWVGEDCRMMDFVVRRIV
ncbi:hypothetical protein N431DRAFT_504810 [Stipitochalara longipes BDJ]|nr:hypothetical protein N431DRAFT_504810 [Stipitochalara longipes BDJ]